MPFLHVYMFERSGQSPNSGYSYTFVNIPEELFAERVVQRWDNGDAVTWDGKSAESARSSIQVFRTDGRLDISSRSGAGDAREIMASSGTEVTNEWITGPAGSRPTTSSGVDNASSRADSQLRDRRRVMVVHGRNSRARDAMFVFLRALGLSPIEWDQAVGETGMATPHNLDAVRAAMDVGQSVVVILTAEDQAGLLPSLADAGNDQDDTVLRGQPRQNVILEAGLALGVDRARTILVELGEIRRASDFDGLNVVRLTNAPGTRNSLRSRLINAGCAVDESASDWMRPEVGGDFEEVAIAWSPSPPAIY